MGEFNTWIAERLFAPVAVDRPLVSDDIDAIRRHYGLQCDGKFTNSRQHDTRKKWLLMGHNWVLFSYRP